MNDPGAAVARQENDLLFHQLAHGVTIAGGHFYKINSLRQLGQQAFFTG